MNETWHYSLDWTKIKVYKPQSAIFRIARHLVLLCHVSSSMLYVITVNPRLVSHTLTDCEPTRWIFCDIMSTVNHISYSDWLCHTFINKIINPIDAYACFHKQLQLGFYNLVSIFICQYFGKKFQSLICRFSMIDFHWIEKLYNGVGSPSGSIFRSLLVGFPIVINHTLGFVICVYLIFLL